MARVLHICAGSAREASARNPRTLLTSSRDGALAAYLSLGAPNWSSYDGLFVRDGNETLVKVLANLLPDPLLEPTRVTLDGTSVLREFGASRQRLFLEPDGMLARCEGGGQRLLLTLDCKRLHDESDEGRIYALDVRDAHDADAGAQALAKVSIVDILYTKHRDGTISDSNAAYRVRACVATTMDVSPVGRWRALDYAYDRRRGTRATPWAYDALSLRGEGHVAIAVGEDAKAARRRAMELLLGREGIASREERVPHGLSPVQALAWRSLHALMADPGILAGLPWFARRWSRDELSSCGARLAVREHERVIAILDAWYGAVREDGTLPAILPNEGLASADALGWLGKRTAQLLARPAPGSGPRVRLPRETLLRWLAAADRIVAGLRSRMRDGLVRNGRNETWMDTAGGDDDGRAGARIEIQALAIAACDGHDALRAAAGKAPDAQARALRGTIAAAVRSRLVREGVLLDGIAQDGTPDGEVRPNLFLAWYASPSLFSAPEWERFFAHALSRLWLDWGGLSTVPRESARFHASDTGEDSSAYHRGDSWYFVNNIAAMALAATHAQRFGTHISLIARASARDLLAQGYVGHASEISSAAAQEAMGCHAQAWSASTLLELLGAIGEGMLEE